MKNFYFLILFPLFLIFEFPFHNLYAQNKIIEKRHHTKVESDKVLSDPTQSLMDINNITGWVAMTGFHDWLVDDSWNGVYPNGFFVGLVFNEGIVWGGLVNDGGSQVVRVNGNAYGTGCRPITRLFRVRTDFQTADLTLDASNFFNIPIGQVTQQQIDEIRAQYQTDWSEWPAAEGAPFKDVDENGIYNPDVDVPGVTGADQTLFIKYNDGISDSLYSSQPIGLEVTETYWAYAVSGTLGNVIFKKVDIKYTGAQGVPPGSYIDSMYICQWSDPDVGTSNDDYAGCDTILNLGYAYNAEAIDPAYNSIGLVPPAIGYSFLQGVSAFTGNPNDSAIINFKWRIGYKYVNTKPMTRFIFHGSGETWSPPTWQSYDGTLEFYNYMRGFLPYPHYPVSWVFPESVTDYTDDGVFLLDGDPVTGIGKIDGLLDGPGNRLLFTVTGPFRLALGESAEVVIANIAGLGNSYLNSITKLKENTFAADTTYSGLVSLEQVQVVNIKSESLNESIPESFILYQNYPNPFNPVTTIKYTVPSVGTSFMKFLQLKVYDVLGNEVATLVNEEKAAGEYEVTFDASKLSSGIYFYQLKTGALIKTKKMILLK